MEKINIILLIISGIISLYIITYSIGYSVGENYLIKNTDQLLQRLLIGISILIIVLRIPIRNDLLELLFISIILLLMILGIIKIILEKKLNLIKNNLKTIIICFIPIVIILLPNLLYGALNFENIGPDLDGHLMSASLIKDKNYFSHYLSQLRSVTNNELWWSQTNAWGIPDFREAVGVEFNTRTLRYGHSILSIISSLIISEKIYLGMVVALGFSLTLNALVIKKYLTEFNFNRSQEIILFVCLTISQVYLISVYEGITAQLIAAPILMYLILNINKMIDINIALTQKIVFVLLISSLLSTFGEGLQIFLLYYISYLIIYCIKNKTIAVTVLNNQLILITFCFLLNQPFTYDFILWSYYRFSQNFIGGAFHVNWDLIALLMNIPILKLENNGSWNLYFDGNFNINVIYIIITMFLLIKKNNEDILIKFFPIITVIFVIILTKNNYALWKAGVFFQPLLIVNIFNFIKKYKIERYIFGMYLLICLLGTTKLAYEYSKYSRKIYIDDYEIKNNNYLRNNTNFVIITPSNSKYYLKLGATGKLIIGNPSDWSLRKVNYIKNNMENSKILLFFSCNAEGNYSCNKAKEKGLDERVLIETNDELHILLDEIGNVDRNKYDKYIKEKFGS